MDVAIERARAEDAPAVLRLLADQHLPVAGLTDHLATALVARFHGQVAGSAALELYPDGALLRSVAVAVGLEKRGVGAKLVTAALQLAADLFVPAVYLLTTTAEAYFSRFGFERVERSQVPRTVQQSVEFM